MGEPVSSTAVTATAAAVAATGWWAGLDSGVVIGAFAGAVFFVISSAELSMKARGGYFFVSFVFGVLAAPFAAELISLMLPGSRSTAPIALGALVAAALAIKLLLVGTTKSSLGKLLAGAGGIVAAVAASRQKDTEKDE